MLKTPCLVGQRDTAGEVILPAKSVLTHVTLPHLGEVGIWQMRDGGCIACQTHRGRDTFECLAPNNQGTGSALEIAAQIRAAEERAATRGAPEPEWDPWD